MRGKKAFLDLSQRPVSNFLLASCVVTYNCYPKAHRAVFQDLKSCLLRFDPTRYYKNKAPYWWGEKPSGTAWSLETIQFDLWFLLRYVLHHALFLASLINQNLSHLLNSFLGLRHLEWTGPASSCQTPWRWTTCESFQEGFQVTERPLYLLVT